MQNIKQNVKQIQKMYNMSTFCSQLDAHAQARMSRNAYSGRRRAYAPRHVRAGKRVDILAYNNEIVIPSLNKAEYIRIA